MPRFRFNKYNISCRGRVTPSFPVPHTCHTCSLRDSVLTLEVEGGCQEGFSLIYLVMGWVVPGGFRAMDGRPKEGKQLPPLQVRQRDVPKPGVKWVGPNV